MSQSESEKLDEILLKMSWIEKALKIVPDKDTHIEDFDSSLKTYEKFAKEELKLEEITIENQKSAIRGFLNHSKGIANKETVKEYLNSEDSPSWKTNQLKALRRYCRDFLKLGRWIEEFEFIQARTKLKTIPDDQQFIEFYNLLPYQTQLVFLVLYTSGLRIGEVLSLKIGNIDFETNMINASNIHKGTTKASWISFITQEVLDTVSDYLGTLGDFEDDDNLFSISSRAVQQAFKDASDKLGISINPHLLRTVFTEKCAKAGIDKKYIDAFCGRIPEGILAKHYTVYSPEALREQYDKVEPYLILE